MRRFIAVVLACYCCAACLRSRIVQIPGYWVGAFPPYSGAKFLCSKTAPGRPENPISSFYAAPELPSQVFAFYADQGLAEEFIEPSTGEYIWQTHDGRALYIINAFGQEVDCGGKIPANTFTIFIVSQAQ